MSISKKEVEHIAHLARIELNEHEKEKFAQELANTLDFVAKLNEVNTDKVKLLYQTGGLVNALRSDKDISDPKLKQGQLKALLGQFPEKEKDFLKVKSVFEER